MEFICAFRILADSKHTVAAELSNCVRPHRNKKASFMTRTNLPMLTHLTPMLKRTKLRNAVAAMMFLGVLSAALCATAQPHYHWQPLSRTNNVGDNAQFTVTATGTGILTYQWQSNSNNISGATSNTLNVLVTDASKAGNYRVLVSDTSNLTNTSSTAALSIRTATGQDSPNGISTTLLQMATSRPV